MFNKKIIFIILIPVIIVLIAIVLSGRNKTSQIGLPNPASVHCEEVGGKLEIRTDEQGGQLGYCTLSDGSVCEEWALLRNECGTNAEYFRNLNIKPEQIIVSPLKITGEVKGGWFFEGSFPIVLVDWDGRIIGEGLAESKTDWMTSDYVKFESEINFTKPLNPDSQDYAKRGAIIFRKDNPSDMRQYDKSYELPVRF